MKRHFIIFIMLFTLFALLSFTAFAADESVVPGDADGDGEVTFEDYISARLAVDGEHTLDPDHYSACDINGDGKVDENELKGLYSYVCGGEYVYIDHYLWIKGEHTGIAETEVQPGITWIFDNKNGVLKNGRTYTVFAAVKFDEGSVGTIYCNAYVYNDYNAAKDGDWSHLMNFCDYASSAIDNGGWQWTDFEKSYVFSDKIYGASNVSDGDPIGAVTFGIGFWNASGGVSVSEIGIKDEYGNVIVSKTFEDGLDLSSNDVVSSYWLDTCNEGVFWGIDTRTPVSPDDPGDDVEKINLCREDDVTVFIFGGPREGNEQEAAYQAGQYKGSLTDGEIGDASFSPVYFAFHKATNVEQGGELNGMTGSLGRIMIDLGEEKQFNEVRLHYYGPLDHNGGIGHCDGMAAFYSDDGENWEDFGDLIYDTNADCGWGDTGEKDTVSARYVLVKYLYNGGNWGFVSELEIISGKDNKTVTLPYSEGLDISSTGYRLSSVKGIGSCTDTEICIPAEYDGEPVVYIDDRAFYECEGITSVVMPAGIKIIRQYAFAECMNLKSVTICSGITTIMNDAFLGCHELTDVYFMGTAAQWDEIRIFGGNEILNFVDVHFIG